RVDIPTVASASAKSSVVPTGTSSPADRSSRANPTAARSASTRSSTSGTARRRSFRGAADELLDPRGSRALLIFAVLQDGAERDLDRPVVDGRAAERGERVRPVDGLRDAGRLVELEPAQRLHCRRDLARELLRNLGRTHAQDRELAVEVGVR